MTKQSSRRLSAEEEREIREAERRLDTLLHDAEQARAEGRLGETIRDTPGVHEQLRSFLDA